MVELTLHGGQQKIFDNPSRFRIAVCGRRWGKTQSAKAELIGNAAVPKSLIWYVAPTYGMAKTIMWVELMESIPRSWIVKANESSLTILLVNGTRIELKGADNPDSLRGVGLNFLVIDEAQDITEETWTRVLRPTLATTGGRAMIIGTPKGYNWLYDLWERGQQFEDRHNFRYWSWTFKTIDSPFIPPEEIAEAKEDMDEASFRQEFEASFEVMQGRVYYPFDRKLHIGKTNFNPRIPIWVGMDFNVEPMSAVIFQPQGRFKSLHAIDEICLHDSSTEAMAEELERRYWRHTKNMTIYPDPAGKARSTSGGSDHQILRDHGFHRIKAKKKHPPQQDRIASVNRMLKSADGQVRMKVDPKCKEFIKSLEQTMYREGTREIDKKSGNEHMTDAGGYMIEYEFPVRKFHSIGI